MAEIHTLGASAPVDPIPSSGHLAIAWHGAKQAQRAVRALAAVGQLLRVPVPDDSEADNGSLRHVSREDLCELLGVVCTALESKTDSVHTSAKAALEGLLGTSLPEDAQ